MKKIQWFFMILLSMGLLLQGVQAQEADPIPVDGIVVTVNVNTASAEEMAALLKGIGMSKASRIVAFREQYGAFQTLTDLTKVKGIGAATIEKNKDIIVFDE